MLTRELKEEASIIYAKFSKELEDLRQQWLRDFPIKVGDRVNAPTFHGKEKRQNWVITKLGLELSLSDDRAYVDFDIKAKRIKVNGEIGPNEHWLREDEVRLGTIEIEKPKAKPKPTKIPKKDGSMFIYLMFDAATLLFKIGHSRTPEFRERTLQGQRPTISMVHYAEGNRQMEKELHEKYKAKRVRGEWFRLQNHDVAAIKKELKIKGK